MLDGVHWPTIRIARGARSQGATTFDSAVSALGRLPRMFVEPDGSFVWVGDGAERWQVDGNLFDRGDELAYMELSGSCPKEQFDELLRCFGWPEVCLVFQLCRVGVFVDESTFRALAERPPQ